MSKPYPHKLRPLNTKTPSPPSFPFIFPISPKTDLWRKPPSTTTSNQPTLFTPLPLSSLSSASVTVRFTPEILYDQAGIVLLWPARTKHWIKAGAEYVDGELKKSIVAPGVNDWSDWSVSGKFEIGQDVEVRIEREVGEKGRGSALLVKLGGTLCRELHWVFDDAGAEGGEVWVGVYGARPAEVEESFPLEVKDWEVRVWK